MKNTRSLIALLAVAFAACSAPPHPEEPPADAADSDDGSGSEGDPDPQTGNDDGESGSSSAGTTGDASGDAGESGANFIGIPDVGIETFEPAYRCDDVDAIIPPNVRCEDAVPGDEAAADVRAAVIDAFGTACHLERICGALFGVDCGAATDGPYLYVEQQSLAVLATCGGACMAAPCLDCPPEGWVCPTY